jgi:hypothetical protein
LDVQLWEAAFFMHHQGIIQVPLPFPTLSRLLCTRDNAEDFPSPYSTSPSPQVSLHWNSWVTPLTFQNLPCGFVQCKKAARSSCGFCASSLISVSHDRQLNKIRLNVAKWQNKLINVILIVVHIIKSHMGGNLPPSVLTHIGQFTEYVAYLGEQNPTWYWPLESGPSTKSTHLLKLSRMAARSRKFSVKVRWAHCSWIARPDYNKDLRFFKCVICLFGNSPIHWRMWWGQSHDRHYTDARRCRKATHRMLDMIEALSDTTSSDGASSVWKFHSSEIIK